MVSPVIYFQISFSDTIYDIVTTYFNNDHIVCVTSTGGLVLQSVSYIVCGYGQTI